MAKAAPDQAEGLRRLFVADARRMIALVSVDGNPSAREVVAGLARSLAGQRCSVLVLDEFLVAGERDATFGIAPRQDLVTLMLAQAEIETAVMPAMPGIDLLAGGAGAHSLPRPRMEARIGLVNAFYRLAGKYDIVLVNARPDVVDRNPSFCWACQDVILLCGNKAEGATDAYAQIKMLHQADERRFHLLFRAIADVPAKTVYRNIAAVSRRHLKVMPEYLGVLPADAALQPGFLAQVAQTVQSWPAPEHKAGHFPGLMRRLLRAGSSHAMQAMSK